MGVCAFGGETRISIPPLFENFECSRLLFSIDAHTRSQCREATHSLTQSRHPNLFPGQMEVHAVTRYSRVVDTHCGVRAVVGAGHSGASQHGVRTQLHLS